MARTLAPWVWAGVLAAGPAGTAGAQVSPVLEVITEPATLVRGAIATLRARSTGDSIFSIDGTLGGEPLHFDRTPPGDFISLAGIPIEGADSVSVELTLHEAGGSRRIHLALPVSSGAYGVERLTVAPKLAEPDSATRVRIAAENARARAVSRAAHHTARLWSQPFVLPRDTRITSVFGTRREFNGRVTSRHMGTDFAGEVGAPVRAANDGIVALVADFYLAGTVVYLDHGEGLVTAYFHLSRVEVVKGDTVHGGQVIGAVGQSGRVTGPHLHWVARYGAISVDPMSLLALMPEPEPTGPASN